MTEDSHLPGRYIPVGVPFRSRGKTLIAVERPKGLHVCEACSGCIFESGSCPRLQCSMWDRRDSLNIWFKEYDGGVA